MSHARSECMQQGKEHMAERFAVQACLYAYSDEHQKQAGKIAELEKIRDDAETSAQVFDDTVANLVRAKMAHATADVTLRAMRDQIEYLSAQVPLENGHGTNSPNWRSRATAQAHRWRMAAEPNLTAAVHKCGTPSMLSMCVLSHGPSSPKPSLATDRTC
jgi:hypothetical protein